MHFKWFEAFMHGRCGVLLLRPPHNFLTKSIIRIELEQRTYADSINIVHNPAADSPERISGLQALLENAPPLPDRKTSWHHALEVLLDGTRYGPKLL